MKGKHRTDLAERHRLWQQRLCEWRESGFSQAEYCRQNKLDPKNFLYWKNKLSTPDTDSLVELPVKLLPASRSVTNSPLCLIIDGRIRIEVQPGFDPVILEHLIRVLRQ